MAEYVLIFFGLLIVLVGLYSLYTRLSRKKPLEDSELYVAALRDLLDDKKETAFSKLRQVVASDSSNVDAYLRLGQILRDYNKPEQALQVHKDLATRGGLTDVEKAAILAQLYYDYIAMDNVDTAEAALKELITLRTENQWALARLLEVQKKAGKWDDAYDTAVKILKIDSNKSKKPLAVFKFHLGEELLGKREYHKARLFFKEALGLDPGFVPAYLAVGDSYASEDRTEDAVNFWKKLIDAVPEEGGLAIERLKKALFELGRFGEIADVCQNILKHSPSNSEAKLTLAEFHEKKGDMEAAEELLGQLVDDNPNDVKSILGLVSILAARGETRKIQDLLRTLEKKTDSARRAGRDTGTQATVGGV